MWKLKLTEVLTCDSILSRRPIVYGLALRGEEVLRALLADTENTLGLNGCGNIDEI